MATESLYLDRTLLLASLGTSRTFPNPKVGAVLVAGGRIIGEGFHEAAGSPHAEVHAIAQAERDFPELVAGATLYVSLEPCNHTNKRTPPCSELIVRKGIAEVVVGCADPNPQVAGAGIRRLRDAGIAVRLAADATPFQAINRAFFLNQQQQRSYITLKWAQTPDGFMAGISPDGTPFPIRITDAAATAQVHRLRATHHAILVGANTARIDNPSLTTRHFYGESPVRIVLDGGRSLTALPPALRQSPPQTLHIQSRIAAAELAAYCYQTHHISSILVEGGSDILQQFLAANAWDELYIFQGNTPIGNGFAAPDVGILQGMRMTEIVSASNILHYKK